MKKTYNHTDKLKFSGYGLICLGFIVPVLIICSSLTRTTELLLLTMTIPLVFNLMGWWVVLSCEKEQERIKGTIFLSTVYAFTTKLSLIAVITWTT
jgi:hypothetical protein